MVVALLLILAGLLLLADFFAGVKGLNRLVRALRPFTSILGVVAIVVGVLSILTVPGIVLLLAGLILGASALSSVPKVGAQLGRVAKALAPGRVLIGLLALIVGVFSLLG